MVFPDFLYKTFCDLFFGGRCNCCNKSRAFYFDFICSNFQNSRIIIRFDEIFLSLVPKKYKDSERMSQDINIWSPALGIASWLHFYYLIQHKYIYIANYRTVFRWIIELPWISAALSTKISPGRFESHPARLMARLPRKLGRSSSNRTGHWKRYGLLSSCLFAPQGRWPVQCGLLVFPGG